MDSRKAPIVILGSGMAGITLLRELRKLDKTMPVVVITADDGAFYSKPNLSNALAAGKSCAQLVLSSAAQLTAQLNAEFMPAIRVEALLPDEHALITAHGRIEYSQLVLALGAHPLRLPMAGNAADEVLSVNNLADYALFRQRLVQAQQVAILGAGLIGCEFANDLAVAGIRATVFDRAPQALGRLLPEQCAAFFRTRLETAGVSFQFDTSLSRIDKSGDQFAITDSRGNQSSADLVLSAIGLTPATELAKQAGIAVSRGIVVDRQLATSHTDVFALGDCAEVQGLVLPFVLPIMHCARALAKTLAGELTTVDYPAMPVAVKTPACPTVVCPPPQHSDGEWHESVTATGARAIFRGASDAALGFALLGDAMQEKQALASQMPAWL